MADITKNIYDGLQYSDILYVNPSRKTIDDTLVIGPSGNFYYDKYVNGVLFQKDISETLYVSPSGVIKQYNTYAIENVLFYTPVPSGLKTYSQNSSSDIIRLEEDYDNTNTNIVNAISDNVHILSPSGYYNIPISYLLNIGLSDSTSSSIYATMIINDTVNNYYGRVPIDIKLYGSGTFNVEAKYLIYGVWKKALLTDNTNLVAGNPEANTYRIWWEASQDLNANLATRLKISISGYNRAFITSIFTVVLNISNTKIPVFNIMNWLNPIDDLSPNGYYIALNPDGQTLKEVKLEASQYLKEKNIKEYNDLSLFSLFNLNYSNGNLRINGANKRINDENLVREGLQLAFHGASNYDWVNKQYWYNTSDNYTDIYGNLDAFNFATSTSVLYPKQFYSFTVSNPYTIGCFFKYPLPSNGNYNTLCVIGTYKYCVRRSDLYLMIYDDVTKNYYNTLVDFSSLSSGWHYLLIESDGNYTRYYIDGLYKSFSIIVPNGILYYIGNAGTSNNEYWGILYEFRLYNRILSSNEKLSLVKSYDGYGYFTGVFDAGQDVKWYNFLIDNISKKDSNIICSFRTALSDESLSSLSNKEYITLSDSSLNSIQKITRIFMTSDTLVVPENTIAEVYAWGAGGAGGTVGGWSYGSAGAAGGFAYGKINLTAGSYSVVVGGKGIVNTYSYAVGGGGRASNNNSDNRYSGGGGGYSGIFRNSVSQSNALLIAGGGGGGGSSRAGAGNVGGAGGGEVGQDGVSAYDSKVNYRGRGGTQTSAGANASSDSANGGGEQSALLGGSPRTSSYGGGGGGGYWGGSAGGYSESNTMAGGGGGSGYYNPTYVSNAVLIAGDRMTPGNANHPLRMGSGNAGSTASNGTDGILVVRYYTKNDASWSGGIKTIEEEKFYEESNVLLDSLKSGRYLDFKVGLNSSTDLLFSPIVYGVKINYENKNYLHTENWTNINSNSFIVNTYTNLGNVNGNYSITNIPGSITTRKQGWQYKRRIFLNKLKVEKRNNDSVILIYINNDSSLNSNAKADGSDIRFTDSEDNLLPFEIEYYSSGTLIAWVKVPLIKDKNDNTYQHIYMYYGNSSVSALPSHWNNGQYNTWDNSYCFVSHRVYGGIDSTNLTNNLINSGTVQEWINESPYYRGAYFDGTSYYRGQVIGFPGKSNDWTIRFLMKISTFPSSGNRYCLFAFGALTNTNPDIIGIFVNSNNKLVIGNSFLPTYVESDITLSSSTIYSVSISYSNNLVYINVNGNKKILTFTNVPSKDTFFFSIGANIDGTQKANIYLDEVRVSNSKRDADLEQTYINIDNTSQWLSFEDAINEYKMFLQEESRITNYDDTTLNYIEGIIDAGRDVAWGKFEKNVTLNGGTLTYKFKSATETEGQGALSGKSWNISSNNHINAIAGRYLGWRVEFAVLPILHSLVFWCWDNKAIYPLDKYWSSMTLSNITVTDGVVTLTSKSVIGYITDIIDLSSDKALDYMVFDDMTNNSTSILYQYRYATDAEGQSALGGKSWNTSTEDLSGITARYVEWKATLYPDISYTYSPSIRKMILGYGGYDKQQIQLSEIDSENIGSLVFKLYVRDEFHSRYNSNNITKEALYIDETIPTVSFVPYIQWNNVVDINTPRQKYKYVLQVVSEDNLSDMKYNYQTIKNSNTDFNSYYSKSETIEISNNMIMLNEQSSYGEVVYRYSDSLNMIVSNFKFISNVPKDESAYKIFYYVRYSNDGIDYGNYQEISDDKKFLINAKYIELTIKMNKFYGSINPKLSSITMEYWKGNDSFVIDELQGNYSYYDFSKSNTILSKNKYYYVRVIAYDGYYYSYWSRTHIFKTSELYISTPYDLKTENVVENQRVITFNPEFTWSYDQNSYQQKYARVIVESDKEEMWQSGKVLAHPSGILPSGISLNGIRYNIVFPSGSKANDLIRGQKYNWKVQVWDNNDIPSDLSESTTFKLNQLPTKPILITATE